MGGATRVITPGAVTRGGAAEVGALGALRVHKKTKLNEHNVFLKVVCN